MVRVPWNEPGIIGKVLDAGAYGVICPMINTVDDAQKFISYCKYPPKGARSNGPIRAGIYGVVGPGGGYQATANDEILCMPMIETQQAIDNLGAILDVPGIDAVYIGPSDLGFSMGLVPKLDRDEPQIMKIYEKIVAETKQRGQKAGIHCFAPDYARKMIDMGFSMVTLGNDSGILLTAAKAAVEKTRAK
jgi:4-hydroxy-2-oxoheptanedioate aldolase